MFQLVLHPLRYPFLDRTIPRPPRDLRAHLMAGDPIWLNANFPNPLWLESSTVGLANTCSPRVCAQRRTQLNLRNALTPSRRRRKTRYVRHSGVTKIIVRPDA